MVYFRGGGLLTTSWWDPAVCHEPYIKVNNLGCDPLSASELDSWPLCFLTPHLVPINIYLFSLVIFFWVLTTKVTESCSFKTWFMFLVNKHSHIRTRSPTAYRWLTFTSLDRCQGQSGRQWPNYNLPFLVLQQQYPLVTFLVLFH
jgi:hypothetical protein